MATKAKIKITEGKKKNTEITVLFNPNEYKIDGSTKYSWRKPPGKNASVGQFSNRNEATLSMDLFFDTSETKKDVRTLTKQIVALLEVDASLHTPPICTFAWGTLNFTGVFTQVNQRFTMFMDDGKPIRAVLSVTIKEYIRPSQAATNKPLESSDRTKERVLKQGEELWMLAAREYEDSGQWRSIAQANNIDNPRLPETGRKIILPPLE